MMEREWKLGISTMWTLHRIVNKAIFLNFSKNNDYEVMLNHKEKHVRCGSKCVPFVFPNRLISDALVFLCTYRWKLLRFLDTRLFWSVRNWLWSVRNWLWSARSMIYCRIPSVFNLKWLICSSKWLTRKSTRKLHPYRNRMLWLNAPNALDADS